MSDKYVSIIGHCCGSGTYGLDPPWISAGRVREHLNDADDDYIRAASTEPQRLIVAS